MLYHMIAHTSDVNSEHVTTTPSSSFSDIGDGQIQRICCLVVMFEARVFLAVYSEVCYEGGGEYDSAFGGYSVRIGTAIDLSILLSCLNRLAYRPSILFSP